MTVIKIAVLVIFASVLSLIVKQYRGEYSLLIQLSCILIVLTIGLSAVKGLFSEVTSLMENTHIDIDFVKLLIKILGVSIIAELSADVCRDTGNSALASNVELFGKIIILTMTFPMLKNLIALATSLLG